MNIEFEYNEEKHFKICKNYIDNYIGKINRSINPRYDTLSYLWIEDNNIIFDSKYYLRGGEYEHSWYEIPISFVQMSEDQRYNYIFDHTVKYKEKCIKDREKHLEEVIIMTNNDIKKMKAELQKYKENYNANY